MLAEVTHRSFPTGLPVPAVVTSACPWAGRLSAAQPRFWDSLCQTASMSAPPPTAKTSHRIGRRCATATLEELDLPPIDYYELGHPHELAVHNGPGTVESPLDTSKPPTRCQASSGGLQRTQPDL